MLPIMQRSTFHLTKNILRTQRLIHTSRFTFTSTPNQTVNPNSSEGTPRGIKPRNKALVGIAFVGVGVLLAMNMSTEPRDPNLGVMDEKEFHPFKLIRREKYNHDTNIYHFALASPTSKLNLPVSSCIVAKIDGPDGKPITRPYTPIDTEKAGEMTLMIKTYPQGNLSKHVSTLNTGDTLLIKGPVKKLPYTPNMKKHVALVAGGSGITPCLQLLEKLLGNPEDQTHVTLLFANRTPEDILLKERLDAYKQFNNRFNLVYFVDQSDKVKDFKGEVGFITREKLKQYLPPPSNDVLVYVCGPPKMYETLSGSKAPDYSQGEVGGALKELGYTKDQVYKL